MGNKVPTSKPNNIESPNPPIGPPLLKKEYEKYTYEDVLDLERKIEELERRIKYLESRERTDDMFGSI